MKDLSGKCLIEIGGDSCAGCAAVLPNCRTVAERFDLKFVRLDVEEDAAQLSLFKIDRIPTVILYLDGVVKAQCSGYQPEEILELWVEAKLS